MGTCSIRTSTGVEYTCGTCVLACGCYTEPLARECGLLESDKDEVKSFGEVKIARRTVLLRRGARIRSSRRVGVHADDEVRSPTSRSRRRAR